MTVPGIPGLVASTTTRHLFLTGKGGVGKTSTACATAIGLAALGRRVLLVSTDPASNLDEVLGQPIATSPTPIVGIPGLSALNVDPEAAAAADRERVIGPYRGSCPTAPSPASRNSSPGRAPWRSPPSTSSPPCSPTTPSPRRSTTSCSTPPPRVTPCACSPSRPRGRPSSATAPAPPASVRSPE